MWSLNVAFGDGILFLQKKNQSSNSIPKRPERKAKNTDESTWKFLTNNTFLCVGSEQLIVSQRWMKYLCWTKQSWKRLRNTRNVVWFSTNWNAMHLQMISTRGQEVWQLTQRKLNRSLGTGSSYWISTTCILCHCLSTYTSKLGITKGCYLQSVLKEHSNEWTPRYQFIFNSLMTLSPYCLFLHSPWTACVPSCLTII